MLPSAVNTLRRNGWVDARACHGACLPPFMSPSPRSQCTTHATLANVVTTAATAASFVPPNEHSHSSSEDVSDTPTETEPLALKRTAVSFVSGENLKSKQRRSRMRACMYQTAAHCPEISDLWPDLMCHECLDDSSDTHPDVVHRFTSLSAEPRPGRGRGSRDDEHTV